MPAGFRRSVVAYNRVGGLAGYWQLPLTGAAGPTRASRGAPGAVAVPATVWSANTSATVSASLTGTDRTGATGHAALIQGLDNSAAAWQARAVRRGRWFSTERRSRRSGRRRRTGPGRYRPYPDRPAQRGPGVLRHVHGSHPGGVHGDDRVARVDCRPMARWGRRSARAEPGRRTRCAWAVLSGWVGDGDQRHPRGLRASLPGAGLNLSRPGPPPATAGTACRYAGCRAGSPPSGPRRPSSPLRRDCARSSSWDTSGPAWRTPMRSCSICPTAPRSPWTNTSSS